MNNRYEIATIADIINKIPLDRLDAFFNELRAGVEAAKVVVAETASLFPEGVVQVSDQPFTWTDDNQSNVSIILKRKQK